MIRAKEGEVCIKGSKTEVKADLSTICRAMCGSESFTKDEIMESVKLGLMSDEELKKIAKKKVEDIVKGLEELLEGDLDD